ncbi:MAG: glucosidase, partial [Candidatus Rokuibacteriota bacterium]
RGSRDPEYELIDTGIFDDDRYFDIFVEYGKASAEDICIRIEAVNRGPEPAPLHLLPHLWFRNTWSWGSRPSAEPSIRRWHDDGDGIVVVADDSELELGAYAPGRYRLGPRYLHAQPGGRLLFTFNETNGPVVYGVGHLSRRRHIKDAFHRAIAEGDESALHDEPFGTKATVHYVFPGVPPRGSAIVRLRLCAAAARASFDEVDAVIAARKAESDAFYASIHSADATDDERRVQRQALAGLLWTKQSYIFDVGRWLDGDNPAHPPPAGRGELRNRHWRHLNSLRVMTVPDKWEYPWFAAWDLAFHCVALALVDTSYAKEQLWALLFEQFQHPSGQIPAYEWEFSDLNPPVHAWAVWRVYNMDRIRSPAADRAWLERCFHKLLMNFAWWVNKVDREGNNIFEGGFLGLDNITIVDRSERFRDGSTLEQSDATGWMGMFCLNLMRIALELAKENRVYEGLASKFFQHYIYVAFAMKHMGKRDYSLWDERDGFFYDVLRFADGTGRKLRVRSLVGLIPLFAVERLEVGWIEPFKEFTANLNWFLQNRREMTQEVVHKIERDGNVTYLLTIVNQSQIRRMLERLYDPGEFLSDYGVRSLSKAHEAHPFEFDGRYVGYEPAESHIKLKGGNSNWRGPIWFPTCFLIIESLRKLGTAFGSSFTFTPAGSPSEVTARDMACDLAHRLVRIFTRDASGRRPVFGGARKLQDDPHFRDWLLFYEYFHGDNGAGVGASHQTGWTALVANLIDEWAASWTEAEVGTLPDPPGERGNPAFPPCVTTRQPSRWPPRSPRISR